VPATCSPSDATHTLPTRHVTAPDRTSWSVQRRGLPHREGKGIVQRFKNHAKPDNAEGLDLPIDIDAGAAGLVLAIVLVVVIALLLIFGWPVLLIGIDLAWPLLIGALGLVGRVILRRPWRVEAVSPSEGRSWFVKGYRAAGERRDAIARQLQRGQNPLGTETQPVTH